MLTLETLAATRSDPQLRNEFLADLAQRHDASILSLVTRSGGPEYLNILDEARQAFLWRANQALDSARTDDDGRGHNDPDLWCSWRGMHGVRDVIRDKRGRHSRASLKQNTEKRMYYAGAFTESIHGVQGPTGGGSTPIENEAACIYFADPNDYADEACANIDLANFLKKLKGIDREVATLLVFGESENARMVCHCKGKTHSYIEDLAKAINCTEGRVFKILRRLRVAAAAEFQLAVA